jgi:DNA-binding PadR family transcriptional regulator
VPKPSDFLPLKPGDFHILMALLDRDLHGYAVMKAVEEETGGKVVLEVGSLYRLLGRLLDAGLLEAAAPPENESDERRKYYRITALGRDVARAEAVRLAEVTNMARAKHLLRSTGS